MTPLYDACGRDLSGSLDRWITGNYGADQFDDNAICKNCTKRGTDRCPEPENAKDDEFWCDSFDYPDESDYDDVRYDEWREREEMGP